VDLLPTFCQIAGAKLPADYKSDGISQLDALMGKNITAKRSMPLFWKFDSPWPAKTSAPDHWVSYAVVYEKWKLVSNEDGSHIELYDIASDIYEKNDLKTQNSEVADQLKKMIESWKTALPAKPDSSCFSDYRNRPPLK
jgi:arylsulfatase A-like enzyme